VCACVRVGVGKGQLMSECPLKLLQEERELTPVAEQEIPFQNM
jgi:hypothetical protein